MLMLLKLNLHLSTPATSLPNCSNKVQLKQMSSWCALVLPFSSWTAQRFSLVLVKKLVLSPFFFILTFPLLAFTAWVDYLLCTLIIENKFKWGTSPGRPSPSICTNQPLEVPVSGLIAKVDSSGGQSATVPIVLVTVLLPFFSNFAYFHTPKYVVVQIIAVTVLFLHWFLFPLLLFNLKQNCIEGAQIVAQRL